ncbi:MAG: hypothetical protein COB15_07260 [Flavobacteriales bacterium]|nr:MAG: hypothetical protein COB15_07260 [Flavobacteriales bacterium]
MLRGFIVLAFILFYLNSFSRVYSVSDRFFDELGVHKISLVTNSQQQQIGKVFFQPLKINWQKTAISFPKLKENNSLTINDTGIYFDVCPLRNHNKSGWQKIKTAAVRISGVEFLGALIILSLPEKYSKWPPNAMKYARTNVIDAYTKPPVIDIDDWLVNYIGHPYAGAAYYNAVRSQDGTVFQSFMLSTFESLLWEYVIEVYSEHPSIQDLLTTSPLGAFFGELAHRATISMRRNGFTFGEKIITLLINPSFVANNGYNPYKRKPKIKVE